MLTAAISAMVLSFCAPGWPGADRVVHSVWTAWLHRHLRQERKARIQPASRAAGLGEKHTILYFLRAALPTGRHYTPVGTGP
jgi:hypothetical protein